MAAAALSPTGVRWCGRGIASGSRPGVGGFCLLLIVFVLGCGRQGTDAGASDAGRSSQPPDHATRHLDSLLEADRAFAASVASNGVDAWVAAFADDGAMLPPGGPVVTGREAIRAMMTPVFSDPEFSMTWSPEGGGVAESGELGYTFGTFATEGGGGGTQGRYVTVWKRGRDGRWLVVADIGNREEQEAH